MLLIMEKYINDSFQVAHRQLPWCTPMRKSLFQADQVPWSGCRPLASYPPSSAEAAKA